jgi:hypothetical protein
LDGERELKGCTNQTKTYADHRRRDLIFKVGDFVYLKVPPIREFCRVKVQGKLAPRFIVPVQDRREKE